MTFYLIILINIALGLAIFALHRQVRFDNATIESLYTVLDAQNLDLWKRVDKLERRLEGRLSEVHIQSKVSEKFAEKAFSMASASSLGVIALQKSLQVPRIMTKHQATANKLAKEEVDELFSSGSRWDYIKPLLNPDELKIIEQLEEDENTLT